jgi:hypothetical protein
LTTSFQHWPVGWSDAAGAAAAPPTPAARKANAPAIVARSTLVVVCLVVIRNGPTHDRSHEAVF